MIISLIIFLNAAWFPKKCVLFPLHTALTVCCGFPLHFVWAWWCSVLLRCWHWLALKRCPQMSSPRKWRRSSERGQSSLTRIGRPIHLADMTPQYLSVLWTSARINISIERTDTSLPISFCFSKRQTATNWAVAGGNDKSSPEWMMLRHNIFSCRCDKKALSWAKTTSKLLSELLS